MAWSFTNDCSDVLFMARNRSIVVGWSGRVIIFYSTPRLVKQIQKSIVSAYEHVCQVCISFSGWLGKKMSKIRIEIASKTDERVRLMNEIIMGIQIIKMYTWEKPFAKLIEYTRKCDF